MTGQGRPYTRTHCMDHGTSAVPVCVSRTKRAEAGAIGITVVALPDGCPSATACHALPSSDVSTL